MNSRETSRAKVDKTFLKNSLALKLIEIRYEHVCCIEFTATDKNLKGIEMSDTILTSD